jgi:hypothetical protein
MSRVERDPERGRAAAVKLRALGAKRILIKAAEQGYITQVACKMPECFCPEELGGACYFEPVSSKWSDWRSDWMPTVEHFPVYKKDGGKETVDNVILAHRLCNRLDHSLRVGRPHAPGRLSIDACMAAIAFLGLAVLATFPLSSDSAGERLGRSIADGLLVLNLCLVAVTFLKGKLKLGLIGIVFSPLSLVGSLRLAKPTSVWARLVYPDNGRRLRRSQERYAARETRWVGRRERVYDLIGGAPHLGSKRQN